MDQNEKDELTCIEFDEKEKKMIAEVFKNIPVTGNIQTLPPKLEIILSIIEKVS